MIAGLKFGDSGAYVQLVQLALVRSVSPALAIDGEFGLQTHVALKNFQVQNNLPTSGSIDAQTASALIAYLTGYVTYITQPGDSYYLLARQYNTSVSAIRQANYGVDAQNLPVGMQMNIPLGFSLVSSKVQYTYYYLSLLAEGLKVRYPFLEVSSIGQTVLGKQMYCFGIGSGDQHLMYNAAHHANEWITTPLVLTFLEDYATAVVQGTKLEDKDARAMYIKTRLQIVPMVDADGVDLVNGVLEGEAYEDAIAIAQGFPFIPFPSGWKANAEGTDLNLNYPAAWERAKKIKYTMGFDRPAPRDFVGATPLSMPESRAMVSFTESNDFLLTISYHTQGEVIYWKFDDYLPPRSLEIGEAFSSASGYPLAATPAESDAAGYKDWFIQMYNRPGYTIEVGRGTSPVSLDQFDEIYKNNLGIMVLGMYLL